LAQRGGFATAAAQIGSCQAAREVFMTQIPVVRTVKALRRVVDGWKAAGERVALVPTMGALHEGHISLVKAAQRRARRIVTSIFVNPAQFAPTEDLAKYPRTFASDRALLTEAKADLIFAPDAAEMYPQGFVTTVSLAGPAAAGLEDAFRPTHFPGVATVVAKLFTQARPDVALFGEKDYQQLQVVRRMALDLDLGVEVIGAPTIRDADGLALSSRNRFLTPDERRSALALHRALDEARQSLRAGAPVESALRDGREKIEAAGFVVDYFALRDADSLEPVLALGPGPARLLVAARIGQTRLIDNVAA
jgi:pantoate--beta-alanine ligase